MTASTKALRGNQPSFFPKKGIFLYLTFAVHDDKSKTADVRNQVSKTPSSYSYTPNTGSSGHRVGVFSTFPLSLTPTRTTVGGQMTAKLAVPVVESLGKTIEPK